ncbi:MAG: hypothetical protein ING17_10340 [Burkholderiales bacterium]|nr:hypothetical protein [Burkholderiales bacterium]
MYFVSQYRFVLLFIFCIAASAVIRQYLMFSISPLLVLWVSSILASLYFHTVIFKKIPSLYQKISQSPLDFLLHNILISIVWVCTYYSIYFSSASLYTYVYFITGAVFSIGFQKNKTTVNKIIASILLLLTLLPFVLYPNYFIGIALGILSGGVAFFYNMLSEKIAKSHKLKTSELLASRFWLLIIIPMFLIAPSEVTQLSPDAAKIILLSTILSMIMQTWASQKSILSIGARETSGAISFASAVTFLVQGIFLDSWSPYILILSLLSAAFVGFNLMKNYQATSILMLKKKSPA